MSATPKAVSVLLRGDAVGATARRATDGATPIRPILEAFIDFQRTDGREALLDVLTATSGYHGVALTRTVSDRVITALFGPDEAATSTFDRDWTVKPGETLREWIEENGLTVRSTATACAHLDPAVVQGIIDGRLKITSGHAAKLQHGTGIPARLWLNLERAYRADLAAGRKDVG